MKTELKTNDSELKGQNLREALMSEITGIMKEHEASLLRYANRLLRDRENARDVVQEVFIRLVEIRRNEQSFQKNGKTKIENLKAWLFKITRNRCLDHLRLKKRQLEISIDIDKIEDLGNFTESERPDKTVEEQEEMQLVRKQIMELEPRAREVVILKFEHDKSYKEIAEIMKLSVGNVGFILHQSIKKIAEGLREK